MNQISGKSVYIIWVCTAALLILLGTMRPAAAQLGLPGAGRDVLNLPSTGVGRSTERLREQLRREANEAQETAEDVTSQPGTALIETLDTSVILPELVPGELVSALSPAGDLIEAETLVVAVDVAAADELVARGVELVMRRDLPALGLSVLTLRRIDEQPLEAKLAELKALNPEALADYNYLYRPAATSPAQTPSGPLPAGVEQAPGDTARPLRIGIIDTRVRADHPALNPATITQRDFVRHTGKRPLQHGTEVASLLVGHAREDTQVFAASVFQADAAGALAATTLSLIEALDWLAAEQVDVMNMSLAGPGDALLKSALSRLADQNHVVVAAVGNNGPFGKPLFPAAYPRVIGVTAIGADNQIYRYAGRGPHVDFAALGVNVNVANAETGAWSTQSGTSMAAPLVAIEIARLRAAGAEQSDAVENTLAEQVTDLGEPGRDPVFGHGRVGESRSFVTAN